LNKAHKRKSENKKIISSRLKNNKENRLENFFGRIQLGKIEVAEKKRERENVFVIRTNWR